MADRLASRGLWIAFFGPDGVGKSAVISQVKVRLAPLFGGILQFHFRPRFGRSSVDRPPVTSPHGQSPRALTISLAKLIYWFLDCWYGYLFAILPGVRRSRLVLFDRYYPDSLVDPLRYRLPESCLRFARCLVALVPRPDLCVLLDASTEVVQRRKSEVPFAESQRQRFAYLALFRSLPDTLLVDATLPVSEVAEQVSTAVHDFVANSSAQQHEALFLADL
jgi:thymidylate kinase